MNNFEFRLKELLKDFHVFPKNIELYEEAMTHSSFSNENSGTNSYERLEFLGDAIIEFFVTKQIFKKYVQFNEGDMSQMRASAVQSSQLAEFTQMLSLDKMIRFGKSMDQNNINVKIKADVFEALVAAIYLDLGFEQVSKFLEITTGEFIYSLHGVILKNPKTELQELLQSESRQNILYKTQGQGEKGFDSRVIQSGKVYGEGTGKTKKEAEVNAAKDALSKVGRNETN